MSNRFAIRSPAPGSVRSRRSPRYGSLLFAALLLPGLPACDAGATAPEPASAVALVLDAPDLTLVGGETARIGATLVGAGGVPIASASAGSAKGASHGITWSSSHPATVSVDATGLLAANQAGEATVTATAGALRSTAHVMVMPRGERELRALSVAPGRATVEGVGGVFQLAATGVDMQNSSVLNPQVGWKSLTPEIATVDGVGRVVARAAGVALIVATAGTVADTAALTITAAAAAPPVRASDIQAVSGRVYAAVEGGMAPHALAYGDRLSHFEAVPAVVQGLTYIRTRNNDQSAKGINPFLSFDIDQPATVVVGYNGLKPPTWLTAGGFMDSGESLVVVRDTDGARLQYRLYARNFPQGRVSLGSNRDAVSNGLSKYVVILRPSAGNGRGPAPPPVNPPAGPPNFDEVIDGVRPRGFGQGSYSRVQPAPGRTMYWVATNGNDANPGTSGAPFRTINRAAQIAQAGDVVTIRNGTYNESVFVRNSGTPAARIVFQAENRGGVVLGGSNNRVFQPLGWVGETGSTGPAWVTLRGLIFRNYGNQTELAGNAVRAGRGWRIEDCLFDRSANTGLNVVDHDVEVHRSTFEFHAVHAFLVGARDLGASSPSDPLYRPLTGIRLVDVVLRGNHTTTQTIDGAQATRVAKIMVTRGLVIDNMASFENRGQGMWLDNKNSEFVVRNSYFHSNRGFAPTGGAYRSDVARGLYLEKNWGGVVENNVMMGNEGPALSLVNTGDLVIRNNLFVRNDRCVLMVNMTGSSPSYDVFPFRNIRIEHNFCKDWRRASGIHFPGGPPATPQALNVTADHNTYEPVRNTTLAWWPAPIGGATAIAAMQSQFGWEQNGRIAPIPW